MAEHRIERVVVTGGRNFHDGARIEADLRALLPLGLRRVAEGACPFGGADDLAYEAWHLLRNESTQRYPIARDGVGRTAPLRRNIRMLEAEKPDLVLAYPDERSRGTWHCLKEACKRGITVAIWAPGFQVWEFEGEDEHKAGIYVGDARGMVAFIDTVRSFARGTAPDGGGMSLDLTDDEPRFIISTFANISAAERIGGVLQSGRGRDAAEQLAAKGAT